jgi:hypothetical protein
MHFSLRLLALGAVSMAPIAASAQLNSYKLIVQQEQPSSSLTAQLPDAPMPQDAAVDQEARQAPTQQQPATNPAAPPQASPAQSSGQGSSSSQAPAAQTGDQKTQQQKAQEQIKEQEQQRVLGVVPNFNISYRSDAAPMTVGQKLSLSFRSAIDPFTFAAAVMVAGYHEALDDDTGFGWGIEGFGKRSGAAYLDAFDGTIIGNGILPALLHQDPRYFRLGHGTTKHRLLYAMATTVMCKSDRTRKWEPNYSNVGGNIISGAISNLYYPSSNSGIGQTIANGLTVTAEGTIGGVFNEFWPDISRKLFHKDPTHGLDAQAKAADEAAKKAKQQPLPPEK